MRFSLPADYYSPSLREVSPSEKLVCRVVMLMPSGVTLFSSPKNRSQVGINISYAKGVKSPASLAAYFNGHQNADHDTHSYNLADWSTIV